MSFIVRSRPRSYQMTEQQVAFREAAVACGIKKGITRADLLDKMRNCLPEFYRQRRESSGRKG